MEALVSPLAALEHAHRLMVRQTAEMWSLQLQMFDHEARKRGRKAAVRVVAAAVTEDPWMLEARLEATRIVQGHAPRMWASFCDGRLNPEHVMAMADALLATDAEGREHLAARAWGRSLTQNIDAFTAWLRREVPGVSFERLLVSGLP